MSGCTYVHMLRDAHTGQARVLDPGTASEMVVSLHVVLRSETGPLQEHLVLL